MYAPSAAFSKLPYAPPQNPTFNPQAKSQPQRPQFSGLLAKDSPPDLGEWSGPRQGQSSNYPTTYKSGDFSIYSPGRAQPTQTPSLGTAYGQQNTQGSPYDYYNASGQKFGAVPDYAPGMSSQQMAQSYGNLANSKGYYRQPQAGLSLADSQLGFGQQPPRMWNNHVVMGGDMVVDADYYNTLRKQDPGRYPEPLQDPRSTQPAAPQNPFANMQPGVYTPYGFTPTNNPLQAQANAIAQRAAIVQQTNQALLPYQYAQATGQDFGAPQFDLAGIRQQAQKMVGDGWYNPFQRYFEQQDALQQIGQYAPPPMYGPQPDPYQQWLATLPGYQSRDQWMTKAAPPPQQTPPAAATAVSPGQAQPIQPPSQGTPYGKPAPEPGLRDTPMEPRRFKYMYEGLAGSPLNWTDQQWQEYESQPSPLADSGGYFRKDGSVYRGYGLGGYEELLPDAERDANGNWNNRRQGSRPGQAQPIQPPSQGTQYGRGAGQMPDLDKDGIDDRNQYSSPQEAFNARDRRNEQAAAAGKLGARSADQIDVATALLGVDRPGGRYSPQDQNPYPGGSADRIIERLGLLQSAGVSVTPAEKSAAEGLAAMLRNTPENWPKYLADIDGSSRAADVARWKAQLSRKEQALRDAIAEGAKWRELSGYEKQWGGMTFTRPPSAPPEMSPEEKAAQDAEDIQIARDASRSHSEQVAADRVRRQREAQDLAAEGFVWGPRGLTTVDPRQKAALTTSLAARMRTGGKLSDNERRFLKDSLGYDIDAHTVKWNS